MTINDFADFGSVVGIFFVVIGLLISIQQFKVSRTMDYMRHVCDPSVIDTRAKVDSWLASSEDDSTRIQALKNDHELHAHVKSFLSFCNQVSIAYRFGILHKKMAFDIWFPLIPTYWDSLHFYIVWRRKNGYPVGHNFEKFAEDMRAFRNGKSNGISRKRKAI